MNIFALLKDLNRGGSIWAEDLQKRSSRIPARCPVEDTHSATHWRHHCSDATISLPTVLASIEEDPYWSGWEHPINGKTHRSARTPLGLASERSIDAQRYTWSCSSNQSDLVSTSLPGPTWERDALQSGSNPARWRWTEIWELGIPRETVKYL